MSSRHFDAFSLSNWFALGIGCMHRPGQAIIRACVHGRLKLREMHVRTDAMRTNRPWGPINKHGSYTHHPRPLPVVVWNTYSIENVTCACNVFDAAGIPNKDGVKRCRTFGIEAEMQKNGLANGKECRQMLKISKLAHVILFIGEKQACYAGRAKAEAEPQKYLSIIGDQWMSVLFHLSPKNCSKRFFSQYQRHWRYHPHFLTVTSFWHLGHFCSKGFFGQSRLSLMIHMGRIPQAF